MIKEYKNGQVFLSENKEIVEADRYTAAFFIKDAELMKSTDKQNYILKVENGEDTLFVLKMVPFNLIATGSENCVAEAVKYIAEKGYELDSIMMAEKLGFAFVKEIKKEFGFNMIEEIAMDFMVAKEITEPSSTDVVEATVDDVDEIYECTLQFVKDCGLHDQVEKDNVLKTIKRYLLYKVDGKIAAMAKSAPFSDTDDRIASVYSRKEYRGKGYARKVVNTLKNRTLEQGRIATLNVDRNNPISNHLYASLGFEIIYAQGIFTMVK